MIKKISQTDYFTMNEKIIETLKNIKQQIHLSMNGVTAEYIEKTGMQYKENYGVGWPRLNEIAQHYKKDYDLANMLWFSKSREQMLIATLLMPEEQMKEDTLGKWISAVTTYETADVLAQLIGRSNFSLETIIPYFEQQDIEHYIALQWCNKKIANFTDNQYTTIIDKLFLTHRLNNQHLANSEVNLLLEILAIKPNYAETIRMYAELLNEKISKSNAYLKNIICEEINFILNEEY